LAHSHPPTGVLDSVTGGNGALDTIVVNAALSITSADSLARVNTVEILAARTQSASTRAHSVVIDSDAELSSITTIDLSGDTNAGSTGVVDLTGVTTAVTLKGVNGGGANTLTGGAGADIVTGGSGSDTITGAAGADTLDGAGGNDRFVYAAMSDFLTSNAVVDSVTGGAGILDTIVVNDALAITASDSLARVNTVEVLAAQTQSGSTRAHSVVIDSNAELSSIITIDLSGDTNASSTGVINLTGVSNAVTLKGVNGGGANTLTGGSGADSITGGSGTDTITGASGVDTLDGGANNDLFIYGSFADFFASNAVVDSVIGGGGATDTIVVNGAFAIGSTGSLARVATVEILAAETQSSTTRAHSIVLGTNAKLASITTIDYSGDTNASSTGVINLNGVSTAVTIKGVNGGGANTLTGGDGSDVIVGGSGNDSITGGAGLDSITLGTGSDTVNLSQILLSANRDNITGFTTGGGAGFDVVQLKASDTSAGTTAGSTIVFQDVASAPVAGVTFTTNGGSSKDLMEFSFDLAGNGTANDLDNFTDGTGLLASLGQSLNVSQNANSGYLLAYQGGNAYLYYVAERGNGTDVGGSNSTVVEAAEISLVAVFQTETVASFTTANFSLV
jgi:Ca2+-binding RTX toxin-like protein